MREHPPPSHILTHANTLSPALCTHSEGSLGTSVDSLTPASISPYSSRGTALCSPAPNGSPVEASVASKLMLSPSSAAAASAAAANGKIGKSWEDMQVSVCRVECALVH